MDHIWNKGTSFPDTKYYYGEPKNSMNLFLENIAWPRCLVTSIYFTYLNVMNFISCTQYEGSHENGI